MQLEAGPPGSSTSKRLDHPFDALVAIQPADTNETIFTLFPRCAQKISTCRWIKRLSFDRVSFGNYFADPIGAGQGSIHSHTLEGEIRQQHPGPRLAPDQLGASSPPSSVKSR